jgi:hypothetical protein
MRDMLKLVTAEQREDYAFRHACVNILRSPFNPRNNLTTPSCYGKGGNTVNVPITLRYSTTLPVPAGQMLSITLLPFTRNNPDDGTNVYAGRYSIGAVGSAFSLAADYQNALAYDVNPRSLSPYMCFLGGGATVAIEKPLDGLASARVLDPGAVVAGNVIGGAPQTATVGSAGYYDRYAQAGLTAPGVIGHSTLNPFFPFVDGAEYVKVGYGTAMMTGNSSPYNYWDPGVTTFTDQVNLAAAGMTVEIYNPGTVQIRATIVGCNHMAVTGYDYSLSSIAGMRENNARVPYDLPNLCYLSASAVGRSLAECDHTYEQNLRDAIGQNVPADAMRADPFCFEMPSRSFGSATIHQRTKAHETTTEQSWFSGAKEKVAEAFAEGPDVMQHMRAAKRAYDLVNRPHSSATSVEWY